jgi:fluoride ion exporter CrcB/FEX
LQLLQRSAYGLAAAHTLAHTVLSLVAAALGHKLASGS